MAEIWCGDRIEYSVVCLKARGSSKRNDDHTANMPTVEFWRCDYRSSQQYRPVSGQQMADGLAGHLCKHARPFTGARATTAAHPARTLTDPLQGGHSDFLGCADVSSQLSGSTSSWSGTLPAHVVSLGSDLCSQQMPLSTPSVHSRHGGCRRQPGSDGRC